MRFLIIQTAFIGDVILATPVMSELKRLYPEAVIDVVVRKGNESLLSNHPAIREVLVFDKKQGKLKSLWRLLRRIRATRYDEVINLHRFASSGIMAAFSGAASRVGFKKNPLSWRYTRSLPHELKAGVHEVNRNLSCIQYHPGAAKLVRPSVYPSEADYEKVANLRLDHYFCCAPASVWFTKQLPEYKWVQLVAQKASQGIVYLLGGPDDRALCERIREASKSDQVINLAGELSFLQSAALMQRATMNYVNDSGPLHFCSAVNAPVTAFFCSTTPDFGFGPLSDQSKVVESSPKPDCKPCGLHGHKACPKGHYACGEQIEVRDL